MKPLLRLIVILTILVGIGIAEAGEKEELLGQKNYIEQKLNSAQSEFQGFVKAYQVQMQTFENDLKNINLRLRQIDQEEKKQSEKKEIQEKTK